MSIAILAQGFWAQAISLPGLCSIACAMAPSSVAAILRAEDVCAALHSQSASSIVATDAGSTVSSEGSVDSRCSVGLGVAARAASGRWRLGRLLGRGAMGAVYQATDSMGAVRAVKRTGVDETAATVETVERLRAEIRITSSLSHPNVIRSFGHEWAGGEVSIFLEYAAMGCMASVLKQLGRLCDSFLRSATRDLVSGVGYLHALECPVLHRDLKAANLLVHSDRRVVIADFGCSTILGEARDELVGSVAWMPPEVVTMRTYGLEADVWSLGCTVLEMATAERPWGNSAFDNILVAMRTIGMTQATPPIPAHVPALCAHFIASCTRREL